MTEASGDNYNGLQTIYLFHARIENPDPRRVLTAVDFEVSNYFRSAISILAATLESADTPEKSASGSLAPPRLANATQ
jgi:hypothetical protein